MNRLVIRLAAVATIAAGAPLSEAAVKAPLPPPPFTWAGTHGANVGGIWANDQIADPARLHAIQSYVLRESGVIGGGVPGYNFQYRQFACIRVGHRLQC